MSLRRPEPVGVVTSDEDLVRDCARGAEAALAELFERHRTPVHRFLDRLVGGPPDLLEDLLQSTFVQVWRSADRFGGRSKVSTWIYGIAHNVARQHLRENVRRRAAFEVLTHRPNAAVATPEDEAARHRKAARLGEAILALPEKLRAAFVLTEIENLSGSEAAAALGINPNALWKRVFEARKRLRALLEAER